MSKPVQEISKMSFFENKIIENIQRLTEGKNNQNFRVETNQGTFFLKICHESKEQNINREVEYTILEKAYQAGIGAHPLVFDAKTNTIIVEYLDVPAWQYEEIRTPEALKSFGQAIRKIHELPPITQKYLIADLLDRYWFSLKQSGKALDIQVFFDNTRTKLDAYHQANDLGFCHNDLCYGHFFKGNNILFVDWELAGMNDIYSDLAAFVHFHKLDKEQTDILCQAYSTTPLNKDKLSIHQDAILLRELLWVMTKLQAGHFEYFYRDYYQRCLTAAIEKQRNLI